MDISPSSPWKTPGKIDAGATGKNDDDAADALQNLNLSEQNKKLQVEEKDLEEKLALATLPTASSGAGGSSGKYDNPDRHNKVLADTKSIIDGINTLEGDKCALWWCKHNVDRLLTGDKPAYYDAYKVHAKNTLKKEVVALAPMPDSTE
jgi:hypothetical protein